jgi:hypothetical protein
MEIVPAVFGMTIYRDWNPADEMTGTEPTPRELTIAL